MILSGNFTSIKRYNEPAHTYTVTIETSGDSELRYIVDTSDTFDRLADDVIMFASDPVKIDLDFEDTFEHIVTRSATLNLVTNFDVTPLLANSTKRDIQMTIAEGNTILFRGYIEPLSWDQPFARTFNTFSLEATDVLCGLKYIKYVTIPDVAININETSTFEDIIKTCFSQIGVTDWEADSALLNDDVKQVLQECMVANSLFGGTSEDKFLSCFDVLDEIGKYLNIYYIWNDGDITVFDWHHIPDEISLDFAAQDVRGTDTRLSNADIYSRIKLECDIETNNEMFDLFGGDTLTDPFANCQKCLTEVISEGEGDRAWEGFKYLCTRGTTGTPQHGTWWKDSYLYDHYFRAKKSTMFENMPYYNFTNFNIDDGVDQHKILEYLAGTGKGQAAFLSFGKTEKITETDDKPVKLPSMKDYLVISVRGTGDFTSAGFNAMSAQIQQNAPLLSATMSGTQLIPADERTTNYIVISGHILLNPVQPLTGKYNTDDYTKAYKNMFGDFLDIINQRNGNTKTQVKKVKKDGTIPVGANNDGAFYTHRYWRAHNSQDILNDTAYTENIVTSGGLNAQPMILPDLKNDKNAQLKYMRSYWGLANIGQDEIAKLPIIACRLKIGNKYCWEDVQSGKYGSFSWITLEDYQIATGQTQTPIDEIEPPVFTIGGNPAIDDYIIGGGGFDICDNITGSMNLGNAKGTAIPVRMSDNLSGEVTFELLGPYNLLFDLTEGSYINVSMQDLVKYWGTGNIYSKMPILQALDSIMLSDFKIEARSDNGGIDAGKLNSDLVYVSENATGIEYATEHSDETIISTMLTSDEADEGSFDIQLSNSHPVHVVGVTGIPETPIIEPFYGYGATGIGGATGINEKPEERYVNDYYDEYTTQRTVIDTTVKLNRGYILNPFVYNISTGYKAGTYKILTYSADLKTNMITLKMKNMQ